MERRANSYRDVRVSTVTDLTRGRPLAADLVKPRCIVPRANSAVLTAQPRTLRRPQHVSPPPPFSFWLLDLEGRSNSHRDVRISTVAKVTRGRPLAADLVKPRCIVPRANSAVLTAQLRTLRRPLDSCETFDTVPAVHFLVPDSVLSWWSPVTSPPCAP